jgi:DNA-binding FrmR family transcriptional regulator
MGVDEQGAIASAPPEAAARDILLRLRRLEGQVRGLHGMIEEGRGCEDVVSQYLAARAAFEEVGARILDRELEECLERQDGTAGERLRKLLRLWLRLNR